MTPPVYPGLGPALRPDRLVLRSGCVTFVTQFKIANRPHLYAFGLCGTKPTQEQGELANYAHKVT